MDNREALEILHTVYDKLNAMTDDQLFDHMMENSPSFRSRVEIVENSILFVPVSVSITQNTNIDTLDHSTTTAAEFVTVIHGNTTLNEGYTCQIAA